MPDLVEEQTLLSDGWKLHVRLWRAPQKKATVALVHGFGEHSGRYGHVARFLNARGYDVWAVDLRGHGRSEGPRAYVESFNEYVRDVDGLLDLIRQKDPNGPLFVLAHSLGGCIATLLVTRR